MNAIAMKDTSHENLPINQQMKFVTLLGTEELPQAEIRTETVYRQDKISVERVIEYNAKTNEKLRILHYDYFNNEKIRAIDEFIPNSGKKYRTVNYVLYKSIDEYDTESGERIRTINYDIKNEDKITSIQEYDIETGKIIKVTLYRRDGKTISSIKEIHPQTEQVIRRINLNVYGLKSSVSEYNEKNGKTSKTIYFNDDGKTVREIHKYNPKTGERQKCIHFEKQNKIMRRKYADKYTKEAEQENIAYLIDSLYNKKLFSFVI